MVFVLFAAKLQGHKQLWYRLHQGNHENDTNWYTIPNERF